MSAGVRWAVDLTSWKPNISELAQALCAVQIEELLRIERFVYQRDSLASLAGRLLIRAYCCLATGLSWDRVILTRDTNNKPVMTDHQVSFNVSHQGKYVVLAGETGPKLQVGVDVMKQEYTGGKPLQEFFRLMHTNFSPHEWKTILSSPDNRSQMNNFFRFWTLKESYVKATGTGITVPLDQISFQVSTSNLPQESFITDTHLYLDGFLQDDWLFQETALDDDHCTSVALHGVRDPTKLPSSFSLMSLSDILTQYSLPLTSIESEKVHAFQSKPYAP